MNFTFPFFTKIGNAKKNTHWNWGLFLSQHIRRSRSLLCRLRAWHEMAWYDMIHSRDLQTRTTLDGSFNIYSKEKLCCLQAINNSSQKVLCRFCEVGHTDHFSQRQVPFTDNELWFSQLEHHDWTYPHSDLGVQAILLSSRVYLPFPISVLASLFVCLFVCHLGALLPCSNGRALKIGELNNTASNTTIQLDH